MDDDQNTGLDADALAGGTEQSEAKPESEKPEEEAKTGTQDDTEGEPDAGEDAGEEKAEADETDKSDEEEEEDKPKKRRPSGSERLKRRNAELEAELASYRSRASSDGEVTQADLEREIGKPPKEEDYKGDFLAYQNAVLIYESAKFQVTRELRKEAEKAKHIRDAALREAAYEHEERVAEFREKVPDFDKTLREAGNLKTSDTVSSLILKSDKSAHLVYHLAKNPDRLDRLNRMSDPIDVALAIGRIESRLSLPSPKTETKAPKPPAPPPKGGTAPSSHERELEAWLAQKYPRRRA